METCPACSAPLEWREDDDPGIRLAFCDNCESSLYEVRDLCDGSISTWLKRGDTEQAWANHSETHGGCHKTNAKPSS
jgi:hypothetical protein